MVESRLEPPVFVMGCGHSGTTLVRELLGSHSLIFKTPDDVKLFRLPENDRERTIQLWNKEALARGSRRWLDKMAAYVHDIDKIVARFPSAKLVVVIRDGRDVALSLRKRAPDFERGVARWLNDNMAARAHLGSPNLITVRYEDVVTLPQEAMRRLFEFIGEPYEEQIFDFWKRNRSELKIDQSLGEQLSRSEEQRDFRTLRKWQISQPLYNGSGKWREELSDAEKAYFKKHANNLLVELGYAKDTQW
jgi:hypothetical protein